jgi:hypothetical protein
MLRGFGALAVDGARDAEVSACGPPESVTTYCARAISGRNCR